TPYRSRCQQGIWGELGRAVSKLFMWGVVILGGLAALAYWLTPEADRLAEQYRISKDKIIIEPKPHGWDFNDGPIRTKHCHYEKAVDVERACPGPDCQAIAVYVSWRKIEE